MNFTSGRLPDAGHARVQTMVALIPAMPIRLGAMLTVRMEPMVARVKFPIAGVQFGPHVATPIVRQTIAGAVPGVAIHSLAIQRIFSPILGPCVDAVLS